MNLRNAYYALRYKIRVYLSARDARLGIKPKVCSIEETIAKLESEKATISMSRLGDGEFGMIFGYDIRYQKFSPEIRKKFIEILHSNVDNHIVCISGVFDDMNDRNEENKSFWNNYLKEYRHLYNKYVDMSKTYYNTTATRVFKPLADKSLAGPRFERWKKLWENRDIVFIEGKQTRLGVGNDLFSNTASIKRILGPSENAFDRYDELLCAATACDKKSLFILALGPTATALSYDLAKLGYQALDLGHIDVEYEWFLAGDSEKKLDNKYTNEVSGGSTVNECKDEEYLSQIIYSTED